MKKQNTQHAFTALLIATTALTINFWAWTILSPLGGRYSTELSLSPMALSLMLAVPVIVGSLGRIVLGIVTDKFGSRNVFATASLLAILPLLGLAFADTYQQILLAGVFLGISGATFVIGIPLISGWFRPEKRGFALGLYSLGNAGTAVSGFLTPRLDTMAGRQATFIVVAVLLFVVSMVLIFWVKNPPGWKAQRGSPLKTIKLAAKSPVTSDLSWVYIITFGAYVAFGVYLPVLLKVAYELDLTDAAARAAGFVLLATVARPFGGLLSDKFGGTKIIKLSLFAVAVFATFVAFQPTLHITTTIAYLSLAFVLGCSNGAVFALIGKLTNPNILGSVTGIVGALGGLGGFFPPLILGFTYQQTKSYSAALLMLAISSVLVLIHISNKFRQPIYNRQ